MATPHKLTPSRRRLAMRRVRPAAAIGRRWARWAGLRGADADDAVGAALLGLVRAAANYRSRRLAWSAYATIIVEGEVRRELNRMGRRRRLLACWSVGASGGDRLERAAPEPGFAAVDLADEADRVILSRLHLLSPREREAVTLYLGGLRWVDVAAEMGVGKARVERLRLNAVAKLRAAAGLD